MEEKYKVLNKNERGAYYRNLEEIDGQTSFFKSL